MDQPVLRRTRAGRDTASRFDPRGAEVREWLEGRTPELDELVGGLPREPRGKRTVWRLHVEISGEARDPSTLTRASEDRWAGWRVLEPILLAHRTLVLACARPQKTSFGLPQTEDVAAIRNDGH